MKVRPVMRLIVAQFGVSILLIIAFTQISYAESLWHRCQPQSALSDKYAVGIRCKNSVGGVRFFAVSTKDAEEAKRSLSLFTTAAITGRNISILYDTSTSSKVLPGGCQSKDCRKATKFELWSD